MRYHHPDCIPEHTTFTEFLSQSTVFFLHSDSIPEHTDPLRLYPEHTDSLRLYPEHSDPLRLYIYRVFAKICHDFVALLLYTH